MQIFLARKAQSDTEPERKLLMGTWKTAIFSDDFTSDVKKEYQTLLAFGIPRDRALVLLTDYFKINILHNDNCRFWFAVAAVQVKYNILDRDVADRVKRSKVLEKLKCQLSDYDYSLPPKKIPKPKIYKENWQLGDVLSYQLVNCKDKSYYKMYVGLHVVRMECTPLSHIIPDLICDEWSTVAMFNYISKEKPSLDNLIKSGYVPIYERIRNNNGISEHVTAETITLSLNPYKGNIANYDPTKAKGKKIYNIEILGNQDVSIYPIANLESYDGMYDCVEDLVRFYPDYRFKQNS